jgi:DNA replication and repair protein RecF
LLVKDLRVRNWRNLEDETLHLADQVTVLFGRNGQGKSNLLEALYYVLAFRSFRTKSTSDLLRWGRNQAEIDAVIELHGLARRLQAQIEVGRKSSLLDGKAVRRDSDTLAGAAAVVFGPDDLRLPRAAAAERRRALDRVVFAVRRPYLREATAFERARKARNSLLRRGGFTPELIVSHEETLAATGARIVVGRREVVAALAARFTQAFAEIHGGAAAGMRYRGDARVEAAQSASEIDEALRLGLAAGRSLDERRGYTGFGPHTDDLEMTLDGRPAREHGSQGQIRSLVLAFKFAELSYVAGRNGEPPLLLLDDVASELDEGRRARLFETISATACQTVITVTERRLLPNLPGRVDWQVREGHVEPAEAEC